MSTYKPITTTEFRVVHLLPGRFADRIQCILETRPSEVKTSYEALSYEWGAESVATKVVDIAHHASPSRAREMLADAGPPSRSVVLQTSGRAWRAAQSFAVRYATSLTFALSLPLAFPLWRWMLRSPFDSPDWTKWIVSRDWYFAWMCWVCGYGLVDMSIMAIQMLFEMTRTKPWQLALNGQTLRRVRVFPVDAQSTFDRITVTPNLELALRHLRLDNRRRTLWIDALCINQQDEDEKKVQIQRMDLIYANATAVLIWLGDCHGTGVSSPCPEPPDEPPRECQHERDISEAFDYIHSISGHNKLRPAFLRRRNQDEHFQAARPGLLSIVRRGWWKRLWVIQEAALGTAKVYIQCGRHICEFERFETAQATASHRADVGTDLKDGLRSSQRFVSVFHEFRYSSYYEADGANEKLSKMVGSGITAAMGCLLGRAAVSHHRPVFHEQPFPQRLLRVLLKTAGHFECRDDRDRLAAVLGVVGGTKKAPSLTASFIEKISSHNTHMTLAQAIEFSYRGQYGGSTTWIVCNAAGSLLLSAWAIFYESRAKHWAISRPEYVMTDSTEVLQAIESKGEARQDDAGVFFRALSNYLGSKTRSLAFLEAAACTEDSDSPSWAPNWRREVEEHAYDFVTEDKEGLAADIFYFTDDGKTLMVVGQDFGRVTKLWVIDQAVLQSRPLEYIQEKFFVLPAKARRAFRDIALVFEEEGIGMLDSIPVAFQVGQVMRRVHDRVREWLEAHGRTVIHCVAEEEETGFVKAGEVRLGDRVVAVPGCYHHLVLRAVARPGECRWKLVGLVRFWETRMETRKRRGYTEDEWKLLLKEKTLKRFGIV